MNAVDEASEPWGIKVTRHEIKNIEPPQSIKAAMEKQMRAEREKREAIEIYDKILKIAPHDTATLEMLSLIRAGKDLK